MNPALEITLSVAWLGFRRALPVATEGAFYAAWFAALYSAGHWLRFDYFPWEIV